MKKFCIIAILLSLTIAARAQQVYVWCPQPEEQSERSSVLSGKNIDLVIYDARQITDMEYVKCSSEEVSQAMVNAMQAAFSDAKFNLLDSAFYRQEPSGGNTTIKIGIAAYHSALGSETIKAIGLTKEGFDLGEVPSAKWVSATGYRVTITTFEGTRKKTITKDIGNMVTRPGIAGQLTAKRALTESYRDAFREVLKFIDNTPVH